jgi:hypothetical protein
MSSRSARALAAQRHEGTPQKTARGTFPGMDEATEDANGKDALVAIIPSETIAFYTPITTIIIAQLLKGAGAPDRYMGLRWGLWVSGILISLALVAKERLSRTSAKWPAAEMAAAGVAFAAWGLSTPDSPLLAETKDSLDSVITLIISGGALLLLGLFSTSVLSSKAR